MKELSRYPSGGCAGRFVRIAHYHPYAQKSSYHSSASRDKMSTFINNLCRREAAEWMIFMKQVASYIQNHINWCWATAAKVVGLDYCSSIGSCPACSIDPHATILRKDLTGLRPDYVGYAEDGRATVDAWQQNIVLHASNLDRNPNGNMPEFDDAKVRALRYVITGDPLSQNIEVITIGDFQSQSDLLTGEPDAINQIVLLNRSLIGNYVKSDGCAHSVVLCPKGGSLFALYDPWDGFNSVFSSKQLFQTGFLTNQGSGVIRWIQYIL